MASHPVELILVRHLATRLAVPVWVIDSAGDLVFFNEPAERVLGRRFNEILVMRFAEWTTGFRPSSNGRLLDPEELPPVIALRQAIPVHSPVDIVGGDGVHRTIEVTAFPLIAPNNTVIGAVAMFWEAGAA
jgi:PAS domain-containing protein